MSSQDIERSITVYSDSPTWTLLWRPERDKAVLSGRISSGNHFAEPGVNRTACGSDKTRE